MDQNFRCLNHHLRMQLVRKVNPDPTKMSEPCAILASHFNGRRYFGRRPVVTLRVSYRPFENLKAVTLSNRSNRFMAQTALEPYLMLANDNFLDRLMSDRG